MSEPMTEKQITIKHCGECPYARMAMIESVKVVQHHDLRYQTGHIFCGKLVRDVTEHATGRTLPDWCPIP